MIGTMLDDATRDELRALRRTDLPPKVRERIEMVTLSDVGWSAPRIADHLGRHPLTVRDLLRSFNARGPAALRPFPSGPAPDAERIGRVVSALRELLVERRTWTSRQQSEALADLGIALGPRQVRRHLKRMGARYRRTGSTLRHNQLVPGPGHGGLMGREPPIGPAPAFMAESRPRGPPGHLRELAGSIGAL